MKLTNKLRQLQADGKALLAVNFYNFETLKGILIAASESNQPVILQLTRSSIDYIGLDLAVSMARSCMRSYGVEAWLHLDHGDSIELVKRCLDAGFDSVMIDASEEELSKNIDVTSEVVEICRSYDVNVEAELGYIAKLGQDASRVGFTKPEDAKMFVEQTGVNALAVAIGTSHGFYKSTPLLQINLLKEIRNAIDIPLVLHGGSGVPDEQLRAAIKYGVCKINLATEVKNTFMKTLKMRMDVSNEIDLRKVFPDATDSVTSLIKSKLCVVNA
ncbi:class II fructose-bisphosphate aldolase [Alkaliflexus imshenetskii]|uniref:class II fructose-bisphosphate aldolase n=1 Tax=Alkaliflexus imshenetskii TaxID=286730 RepID=UPI000478CED9|nr:class II fructose-bisphosphate aldolase [Alkaliflexus imshenetskii]